MPTFCLTNRRETEDSVRFDLLLGRQPLLQQVIYMKAFNYLLEHMADDDLYQEREDLVSGDDNDDSVEKTGKQLRAIHAERVAQIATMPQLPCVRCDGATTWIGYCDIAPYGPYQLQHTFFLQCQVCGLYRQIGFQNQDDWRGETYRQLMQDRIPFVRTARDPFLRNDTLRVTTRNDPNPMGRVNLNGYEFSTGEGITIYDQDAEEWRDGRIEYGYSDHDSDVGHWYFTSQDGGPDLVLKQGMKARMRHY
jgi:hypothetical protein